MSFKFSWNPGLINSSNFKQIAAVLEEGLKKGPKPEGVIGDVTVDDIQLGSIAPRLQMIEVTELDTDQFKGVFYMVYDGDASITMHTQVEANALITSCDSAPPFALPHFASSLSSLPMPLQFTISHVKLAGTITLVVSKKKGVILVFRDDPLKSIKITSSLDSIPEAANRIKPEIEQEIRLVFQNTIPEMLYELTSNAIEQTSEAPDNLQTSVESLNPSGLDEVKLTVSQPAPTACINAPAPQAACSSTRTNPTTALSYTYEDAPHAAPAMFVASYNALQYIKNFVNRNMTFSINSLPTFNKNIICRSQLFQCSSSSDTNSIHDKHLQAEKHEHKGFIDRPSVEYIDKPNETYPLERTSKGPRRVIKLQDAFGSKSTTKQDKKTKTLPTSSNSTLNKPHANSRVTRPRFSFSASNSLPCTPVLSPQSNTSQAAVQPKTRHRSSMHSISYPPPLSLSPDFSVSNPSSPSSEFCRSRSNTLEVPMSQRLESVSCNVHTEKSIPKPRSKSSGSQYFSKTSPPHIIYDNPSDKFPSYSRSTSRKAGQSKVCLIRNDDSNFEPDLGELDSSLEHPFVVQPFDSSIYSKNFYDDNENHDSNLNNKHNNSYISVIPPSYSSSISNNASAATYPLNDYLAKMG